MVAARARNRGGLGYSVDMAIANGIKHNKAGYSLQKANADNFAVQVLPKYSKPEAILETDRVLSPNQGLPKLVAAQIETIAGTHGNVWLRAVHGRIACTDKLVAPEGFLDPEYLSARSAGQAQALQVGLEYTVIHPAVFTKWPKLIDIGVAACNVRGHAETSETER